MNWNHWLVVITVGIISATIGFFIGRSLKPDISSNPLLFSGLRPPAKQLDSALGLLLSKSPAELEQVDVETLYLSCMAGLSVAENVDLNRARAYFAELAKLVQSEMEKDVQPKANSTSKALVLMDVLKAYEQEEKRRMTTSLPENLFPHNFEQEPEAHFASPLEAALAGQPYHPYVSLPEDSIPQIPHDVVALNNPMLVLIIGRLLGYPLYLVKAPDHLFVRWQSEDGKTVFDLDEIGRYGSNAKDPIRYDGDYSHPPEEQMKAGGYFKSLTHADLMAFFLQSRGHFMEKQQRRFDAELAFAAAHRFAPDVPIYQENMLQIIGEEMQQRDMTWKDMAEHNGYYLNLSPPKPDKTIVP